MTEPTPRAPRPQEQLPIALFEGVVLAARNDQGAIFLGLRDLSEALGLDFSSQRRRLVADNRFHLAQFRVVVGRQFRTLDFLLLDDVALWIVTVQPRRVAPAVQERFRYVQQYLEQAVRAAFAQLVGLPDGPSTAIEELTELDRINAAFTALAELGTRQTTLEASQDRARTVFRDLAAVVQSLQARVQQLEQRVGGRISPAQRNTLYRLVHAWGAARAERDPTIVLGTAIRRCWGEVNARCGVATYTDIAAARYDEAVQFVQQQYQSLTGQELPAVEQAGLELEP